MLTNENYVGAWVRFDQFGNGRLRRGQVVDLEEDGRFKVIEYRENGAFSGVSWIDPKVIVEVIEEGNNDSMNAYSLERKAEAHIADSRRRKGKR